MHSDLDESPPAGPYRSSFCLIGGGIAGLILAQRLARRGQHVCILEAGGLELEPRSQELYQAEMAATPHTGSIEGRFRTLGGSSTRWGGQLLPYTKDIFNPVSGSPSVPWPIGESELSRYYDEIERIMHVDALPFTDEILPMLGRRRNPFSTNIRLRYSKWAPFHKRNLAHTIGRECLQHPRIEVFTHANTTALHTEDGRVVRADVVNYKGQQFSFNADHFIVCCGTVESSRLLLASPGIPNTYDQLGRYFHDHVSLIAAVLPQAARDKIFARLGPFLVKGILHTCKMEASTELQNEQRLPAVMAHITVEEPVDSGIAAVRNLLNSLQRGRLAEAFTKSLVPMLRGTADVVRLLWDSKIQNRRTISKRATVHLRIDMEQAALPANRIRLSEHIDALGMPKAVVDWRVGDAEYAAARKFTHIIRQELQAAGFSALEWTPGLLDGVRPAMTDTYHPMGGLRMGLDPAQSVVDANLKLHGMANLHVASCAVYPSGGSSNPTFTLMALAMRLADHLSNVEKVSGSRPAMDASRKS